MGGIKGVLERSAEEVYERLESGGQVVARQLFLRLVTLGEGVEDTRRRVLRSELEALDFSRPVEAYEENERAGPVQENRPESMPEVIDTFGQARLLSFNLDPLTRTPTAEITHEALLREWPRLRGWLDDGRADVRTQRALAGVAVEWEKADRDPSFLLHGARLSQFESWVEETDLALTREEREFLLASLEQREAQRRAEEERKTHLATLERRSRNFLRGLVGVFAAAAVIAVLLSLYAFNQQDLARRAEAAALQAQALSVSRELSVQSDNNLQGDPERSILLSLEALRTADTLEAREALRRSLRSSRLRMTLYGHTSAVYTVQFSPDGNLIASAAFNDNEVILWDTNTGQELVRLPGIIARFSPDGSRLATGGGLEGGGSDLWDTSVYLWDTTTWKSVFTMQDHTRKVQDFHFNPQGTLLASASLDDTFIVWDVDTGRQVFSGLAGVAGYWTLDNLAFSADGKLLYVADYYGGRLTEGYPGAMRVYGVEQDWALLNEYPSADTLFNFSPDGRWLVSRGGRQLNGILLRDISGHPGEEMAEVAFSELESTLIPDAHAILSFKFSFNQDGSLLASAGGDGIAKIWRLTEEGAELLITLSGHKGELGDVDFSPDGKLVATASDDGTVRVWDISFAGASEGFALDAHHGMEHRFAFTPDGSLLATGSLDGTAKLWNPKSGELLLTIDDSGSEVFRVDISPDGKRLATGAFDHKARIYELDVTPGGVKAELMHTLTGHDPEAQPVGGMYTGVTALVFSTDGSKLATGGADGFVIVWQTETGQELWSAQVHPHGYGITNLDFSPDNRYLATATTSGDEAEGPLVKIWDVSTGKNQSTFKGHVETSRVWGLDFSPDGERMATSGSNAIKLWERATGNNIAELTGHSSIVIGLVFSQDGKYLASSSADESARLWDLTTGEVVQVFPGPGGPLTSAAFSPDGKYLLVSGSGYIYGFILDQEDLVELAHSRLTRWFTADECLQYLHQETCPDPPPGTRLAIELP